MVTKVSTWAAKAALFKAKKFDFITVRDGVKHKKQEEALYLLTDDETTELCYGGAARGGKSWNGCTWQMFMCMLYPGVRYFVARIDITELEESTLVTFNKVAAAYGIKEGDDYKYNQNKHYLSFTNGSRISFLSLRYEPSDPDYNRFGSTEYTGGWLEEAPESDPKAREILSARIGEHMNEQYGIRRMLYVTCNPNKSWPYHRYYLPNKKGLLPPNVKYIQAGASDNIFNPADTLVKLDELTGVARERLRDGNWDYAEDDTQLCSSEDIEAMFSNVLTDNNYGNRRLVADLAMQGRDSFVVALCEGNMINILYESKKSSGAEIEAILRGYMAKYDIPPNNVIVDASGMGEYLESYLRGINEFRGQEVAKDSQYVNIKTELAFKLAELVTKKQIRVNCQTEEQRQRITNEMACLMVDSWDKDERKKRIVKKEDMKKKLNGASPDFLDVLIMAMYFDVVEWDIGVYY